jgi:secreted trypsin-like serine protease
MMETFFPTTGSLILAGCLVLGLTTIASGASEEPRNTTLNGSTAPHSGSTPYNTAVSAFLAESEPKIVNGKPAPEGAYPSQVSLEVSWIADPVMAHFCGGSVYNENWIVTAAHCVIDTGPQNVVAVVGTNKLLPGVVRHNIKRIVVKGDYDGTSHNNDIALLELYKPLTFDKNTKPISLLNVQNEKTVLRPDQPLIVIGWGATQEGGEVVRDLNFVEVPLVDREICNAPLSYNGQITDNMLCAGPLTGGKDSCQGDSGGPLLLGGNGTPELAGVVSWGEGCAKPRKVGVYTRVAKYSDWVAACVAKPDTCQ